MSLQMFYQLVCLPMRAHRFARALLLPRLLPLLLLLQLLLLRIRQLDVSPLELGPLLLHAVAHERRPQALPLPDLAGVPIVPGAEESKARVGRKCASLERARHTGCSKVTAAHHNHQPNYDWTCVMSSSC